tara:strand:+ start:345 stop:719 length:375 start_codon:yes stop_codon:yes gene_type:complete
MDNNPNVTAHTKPETVATAAFQALKLKEPMTLEAMTVMMNCAVLFDKKQHDYGSKNIAGWASKNQNIFGVLVRLNDKIQRLANLIDKQSKGEDAQVCDESLADTSSDICNYGAILTLLVNNRWE